MRATKIEVAYDRTRRAWVVRPFIRIAGRLRDRWRSPLAVYVNDPPPLGEPSARERAIDTGRKLGRAFGANPSGRPCELYIRLLDGTISERETYPRSMDPPKSKG